MLYRRVFFSGVLCLQDYPVPLSWLFIYLSRSSQPEVLAMFRGGIIIGLQVLHIIGTCTIGTKKMRIYQSHSRMGSWSSLKLSEDALNCALVLNKSYCGYIALSLHTSLVKWSRLCVSTCYILHMAGWRSCQQTLEKCFSILSGYPRLFCAIYMVL